MRRILALLMTLVLLLPCAAQALAVEADGLPFAIRNGSRDLPRVAVTVDDCFDMEKTREIFELVQELGVAITFFPLGCQLKEEDGDLWRAIAESPCEIGSHTFGHFRLGEKEPRNIISTLGRTQQALDAVLGYHYQIRTVRPPYGNYKDENDSASKVRRAVQTYGVTHLINWDVSQTDPDIALTKVKNGSILLYHARKADLNCLKQLIPALQAKGYELVTVCDLLGFDPPYISDEPYVFNSKDYYD